MAAWKDKSKVRHRYDVTAEIYDERYAEEQKVKYCKALEKANVKGKTVLDVGCGSGLFFERIASQAKTVIGVDISIKLLQKANQQAKRFSNISVVQADVDNLPFKDGFFGAIFAFTILQNMPKPAKTLFEIKRVASSGSRVVVTGLKKAFPKEKFIKILEDSGCELAEFVDKEFINCYIAILST